MNFLLPRTLAAALLMLSTTCAVAQERTPPLADVLNLDASVTSDVAPDLAVVTLAIVREGPDVASLTQSVNEALAKGVADANTVPGVVAANGGYSTSPRFENHGAQNLRTGWEVRAELVLKSRDFGALGTLVGRLAQTMQIAGSRFEISPELSGAGKRVADRSRRPRLPGQGGGGDQSVRLFGLHDPRGHRRQRRPERRRPGFRDGGRVEVARRGPATDGVGARDVVADRQRLDPDAPLKSACRSSRAAAPGPLRLPARRPALATRGGAC